MIKGITKEMDELGNRLTESCTNHYGRAYLNTFWKYYEVLNEMQLCRRTSRYGRLADEASELESRLYVLYERMA